MSQEDGKDPQPRCSLPQKHTRVSVSSCARRTRVIDRKRPTIVLREKDVMWVHKHKRTPSKHDRHPSHHHHRFHEEYINIYRVKEERKGGYIRSGNGGGRNVYLIWYVFPDVMFTTGRQHDMKRRNLSLPP